MRSIRDVCLASVLAAAVMAFSTDMGYDEVEASMMVNISAATYCAKEETILDWSCAPCKASNTPLVPGKIRLVDGGVKNASRVLVGKLEKQPGCLVAFRGTRNPLNWARDFQMWKTKPSGFGRCDGCQVHSGFVAIWKNLKPDVVKMLQEVGCTQKAGPDNLIYITGHSLGAALTTVAMFALKSEGFNIAKTYTFESPRVGNKAFAEAFNKAFTQNVPVFRITHHMDPYVHEPPEALGYTHVATEVYYDVKGSYTVCRGMENKTCADQYWNLPSLLTLHQLDHCWPPLKSGGNICYPKCDDTVGDVLV